MTQTNRRNDIMTKEEALNILDQACGEYLGALSRTNPLAAKALGSVLTQAVEKLKEKEED